MDFPSREFNQMEEDFRCDRAVLFDAMENVFQMYKESIMRLMFLKRYSNAKYFTFRELLAIDELQELHQRQLKIIQERPQDVKSVEEEIGLLVNFVSTMPKLHCESSKYFQLLDLNRDRWEDTTPENEQDEVAVCGRCYAHASLCNCLYPMLEHVCSNKQ